MRNGKICNPEKLFFDEKKGADVTVDCRDAIIAPGFIDVQINGRYLSAVRGNGYFILILYLI